MQTLLAYSLLGGIVAAALAVSVTGCGGSPTATAAEAPITVATPSISVPTGTYTSTQQVTLSDSTQGSTIYYTTDGSIPAAASTQYQGPITIATSSTIHAIAILNGAQSAVAASTLTITPPPQAKTLTFVQQPTTVPAGAAFSPAIQVGIEDNTGNIDTSAANVITIALAGANDLTGTSTAVPQNGVAIFSNLSIATAGSGCTLVATSPGLVPATSRSFTVTPVVSAPIPVKLAFTQQPSNSLTGSPISPAITVIVEDANANPVTAATNPVTLALTSGSGLAGTLTATPANGVATFSSVTVATPGTYTLAATSAGLASATSTSFTINAPVTSATTILQSMPVAVTAFPGGSVEITYNWLAAPLTVAASVFVNFVDSNGTVQYQDNLQPPVSPSQWSGPVSYTHTFTVPAAATAGKYSVVAGLQSTQGNVSLTAGPGVILLGGGEYQIGTVTLAQTCPISTFGAVGDGVTDNAVALQNSFNYAAANGCIALVPSGTFAYTGNLNASGIAIAGTGVTSVLKPLSNANEALILGGSGGSVSNLVMVSAATSRLVSEQSGMIWVNNADHFYIENVLINISSSTGILSANSFEGYILNNTIEHTLADSVTQVQGSHDITVAGNRIFNSGDDGISNNSYVGDASTVHAITVQGNTIQSNVGGRGLEVSGGSNVTFTGNFVDNLDGYTDMYIASEREFNTQSVANITVSGNSFLDGGPNQGSAIVYNSQGSETTITGVAINGNQFINPKLTALEFAGNGNETMVSVDSNTDYSNNPFSASSNPNATPTETGNEVLAPSTYTTPLVSPGGGCNFNGC